MIKKLRRKFILISMVSVFFVLAVTIASLNIANYFVIENNAGNTLNEIIQEGTDERPFPNQNNIDNQEPPGEKGHANLRQEHYFIVSFNNDGSVNKINNRQMFIYSEEECTNLATRVYNNELTGGKYYDFRYKKQIKEDGLTYVGFLDLKERLDSFKNYLWISIFVSLGAYLVLFGLILLGSQIAFKSSLEAYKKQKRFITNASHELKTPLTVISADLDLIEMEKGKNEWSESIRDQLSRLNEMTNQLVTLSKLEEEDKSKFPFVDFSINNICHKAIEDFTPLFKKEKIKFSSNITGNLTMFGNEKLISELIYIFLDNSVKYTGGDNKSSYFVVSKNNKNKIEFRFSNTIDNNDEVDIKQITDRFYRSPSNKKDGSGIGLSVVEEIVKIHKGKLKIEKNHNSISFLIIFN